MLESIHEGSPRVKARVAGLFELLEALLSGLAMVAVPRMLIVTSDAAATAANIRAHEGLLQTAILAGLLGVVCHIVWIYLFYELFKPVSRSLSLLAVFLGLVATAVQGFSGVLQAAPLILLQAGAAPGGLTSDEVTGLAFIFLQLSGRAFNTYLVFFGSWCLLIGYLIVRSTFMPRIIGLLEMLAGLAWLTLIWPPFAHAVAPYNQLLAFPGEVALTFWLLIVGVDAARWNEQAKGGPPYHHAEPGL